MSINAAIDIGTNSVRLLVVEVTEGRLGKVLANDLVTTRIGEGMATSSNLKDEAIQRTLDALQEFKSTIEKFNPDKIRAVATSAVRDAANGQYFRELVKAQIGLQVEIISGEEEAYLSYLGVTKAYAENLKNTVVVDVGGGSTELIWLDGEKQLCLQSIPIGAVRLSEGAYEDVQIAQKIKAVVRNIPKGNLNLIGVGGTITSLAAIDQKLVTYESQKVHGYKLTLQRIQEINYDLKGLPLEERMKVPGVQPARADIILHGIKIFELLLKTLMMDKITVSEADILHGIIFSLEKNIS